MSLFLLSPLFSAAFGVTAGLTTGHTDFIEVRLDSGRMDLVASIRGLATQREPLFGGALQREQALTEGPQGWVWAVAAAAPDPGLDPDARPTGRVWFVYEPAGHVWRIGEFTYRGPDEARRYAYGVAAGPVLTEPGPDGSQSIAEPTLLGRLGGTRGGLPADAYNFFLKVDLQRLDIPTGGDVDLHLGPAPSAWRDPPVPPRPQGLSLPAGMPHRTSV